MIRLAALALAVALGFTALAVAQATMPSWNDGTLSGPRFALIVHHDDAAREWAYDRTSSIGKLDKAWDEAVARHWTVVSMNSDWKTIFAGTR